MRVDMRMIEVWLEEKILDLLSRQRGDRMQEMSLHRRLVSKRHNGLMWGLLITEQPGWALVGDSKRQRRLHKVLQRMVRERKVSIYDESGDPSFSEDYTRYVKKLGLLDRIALHLGDDDGPQV